MPRRYAIFAGFLLSLFGAAQPLQAQITKPILDTKIVFAKDGSATVSYNTFGAPTQDAETSKIESALVFYAYTMNKLDETKRKELMGEVQAAVSKLATDKGLVRADIVKNVPLIRPLAQEPSKEGISIKFGEMAGKEHSMDIQPPDGGGLPMDAAVLYYFQDLTKGLSSSGLRLMTLSMGGINKWYREKGQASDPNSVSQAPAYALNLAVDIIEKLSGKSATK